ncbi:MAG: HNH endonuclease [Planctomycetes bacterium]|nr:HNH endonuclease [Planctomycetota bacterium]
MRERLLNDGIAAIRHGGSIVCESGAGESDAAPGVRRAGAVCEARSDEERVAEAESLVACVREAAREGDRALLRAARAFVLLEKSEGHRELGFALAGDLAAALGIHPGRARELGRLGHALARFEGLEQAIREEKLALEKAIAAAPAMVESRLSLSEWLKEMRWQSVEGLRRIARRARQTRIVDGRRVTTEWIDLSAEGRTMLFDLQAKLSRMKAAEEARGGGVAVSTSRSETLQKAIRGALDLVRDGAAIGERLYRIAEHPAGSFEFTAIEVGGERTLVRAERARFEMRHEPPADLRGEVARVAKRLRMNAGDALAVAERAVERGLFEAERRPLAHALVQEIREALRGERTSWYRVARALVCLDRLGVPDWREWVALEIGRSASTLSELLSVGKAAERHPELARALEEGKLGWTHVRTLAPYLDDANFGELFRAMLGESVRELEKMRRRLAAVAGRGAREAGGGTRGGRTESGLAPVEIELPEHVWRDLEVLSRLLAKGLGRKVSAAEAIEEALWQVLARWGGPSPLWESYRILVHEERGIGLSWMLGPGGETIEVRAARMEEIRAAGALVYDVAAEEEAAGKREQARVARAVEPRTWAEMQARWRDPSLSEEESFRAAFETAWGRPGRAPEPELALRRLVYIRDGCRCGVCGCHATLFVHVHHVDSRAEGGGNDPGNLVVLCTRCHAVTHSNHGRLVPRAPGGIRLCRVSLRDGGSGWLDRGSAGPEGRSERREGGSGGLERVAANPPAGPVGAPSGAVLG